LLLFNFLSRPKARAWPCVSFEDDPFLSPIFETLIDPSDQADQLSGIIDLSFLASNSFVSEVSIALPKSNLIFCFDKLSLPLFCFK
jgi:hypothetical protein